MTNIFSDNTGAQIIFKPDHAIVDICFIHGLNGGSISTWTKGDIFWPFNLLAHDIPDARVISWGYNAAAAHFLSPTSTCSVKDHAGSLLNDLRGHRNTQETSKRPIILIAHSLGGLVCAKSLLLSRSIETASMGRLCDNVYALMFMGTPFEGSSTTKWVDFFERFAKLIPATNINKTLTDHLRPDSHDLKALTEEFAEWLTSLERQARGGIQVMCFFEEFPSRPGGQIVPRESAKLSGHHVVSISADHTGICKFDNFKDPKYKAVVHHLQKWVDEIKAANTAAKPKTDSPLPTTITMGKVYGGTQTDQDYSTNKKENFKNEFRFGSKEADD